MHWPDIFFKSKKPKPVPEAIPEPKPEAAHAAPEPQPPKIKPVPATATVGGPNAGAVAPVPSVAAPNDIPAPVKIEPQPPAVKATRTIPATHGVVLRPPTGRTVQANATLPQIQPPRAINPPPRAPEPMKNIEQLMAEADPVRTLRQTGNVRVLAPLSASTPETAPLNPQPAANEPMARPSTIPPTANLTPVPTPMFRPAVTAPFSASRKIEPTLAKPTTAVTPSIPVPLPIPVPVPVPVAKIVSQPPPADVLAKPVPPPEDDDSPFILKSAAPVAAPEGAPKILPPAASSIGSIFRRKARMADVARIVLPPKREDTQQLNPAPATPTGPTPTVVPPAFPVAAMTARASQHLPRIVPPELVESSAPSKIGGSESTPPPPFAASDDDAFILKPAKDKSLPVDVVPAGIVGVSNTELPALDKAFDFTPPGHQEPTPLVQPVALVTETRPIEPLLHTNDALKVDPEAHKPEPTSTLEPRIDPEAHKTAPHPVEVKTEAVPVEPIPVAPPASAAALSSTPSTSSAPTTPEKREFHLANGERVAGTVLSETPEAVYIEHSTLGVITIPRANIAKRLVEIILVNGDRIVGDILAETADTLYVRHASLGMLTVPRAQRSTRVVEAILKDGDRILGEVLTETDTFTVIRSASLGTITVPHSKLAMLNRKVEQIELKALPPVAELKDKAP